MIQDPRLLSFDNTVAKQLLFIIYIIQIIIYYIFYNVDYNLYKFYIYVQEETSLDKVKMTHLAAPRGRRVWVSIYVSLWLCGNTK